MSNFQNPDDSKPQIEPHPFAEKQSSQIDISQSTPNQQFINFNDPESNPSQYSQDQSEVYTSQNLQKQETLGKEIIIFPKNNTINKKFQSQNEKLLHSQQQIQQLYPWLNEKTRSIENPLIKLHNEIIDYFLIFQEEEQTHNHLLYHFTKLQGLLFKTFKNCDVLAPFLVNKVYLKNGEVQIFLLFDPSSWKSPQTIEKVRQCLQKVRFEQIRFFQTTSQEGRENKVGFNCLTPQRNYVIQVKLVTQEWISYLSMINDVLQNNLQAKFIYLLLDTMVRQRGMQNLIKGYFLFGLISVFFNERKRQRSRSLTENLLKFLQYFGIGPFTERKIAYIDRNEFEIVVDEHQSSGPGGQFSFWIGPNVQISNNYVREFFSLLRNRYRFISNFNFSRSPSILAALINPSEQQFKY